MLVRLHFPRVAPCTGAGMVTPMPVTRRLWAPITFVTIALAACKGTRSEERRVGKECRFGRARVQAEDGIRDHCVTGVQTCALPILRSTAATRFMPGTSPIENARPAALSKSRPMHRGGNGNADASNASPLGPDHVCNHRSGRLQGNEIGRASCRERV